MKISITFVFVFVCYTICYCCFAATSTDQIEVNPSIDGALSSENATNIDGSSIEPVINSGESALEPSDDNLNSIKNPTQSEDTDDSLYKQENGFLEVAQNSGAPNEITGPNLDIIHTLADAATLELQDKADELSAAPTISDTSHNNSPTTLDVKFIQEPIVDKDKLKTLSLLQENDLNDSDNINQTEQILNKVPSTEPKINITDKNEEIPSFSEWTQKQLEEAERKKEEVNASVQNQSSNGKSSLSGKKRWKNYASPDCGAKIVATNPEAISAASVLSTSRDEYKLNTCTSRIWFVVELCEAIQAKKIDLANFELFSSSPKDFSISVSDRFTTRDWSSVGHFTAKDERDIQSFDLYPHLFGKFIKFEMHSHHGSEHYCPISLFRVYGTSEFEVLETENQVNVADDDDDDETLDADNGEVPKNLFSSATDAVISIVKKAAEALGNKGNRSKIVELPDSKIIRQYVPLVNSCTTPSHVVVCENCTDLLFGYVFELMSCRSKELGELVKSPFINKILYHSNICMAFGLDWQKKSSFVLPDTYKNYLTTFFPPKYIAALCNTVAINECKVVLNISHNATIIPHNIENIVSSKSLEIVTSISFDASSVETAGFDSTVIHSAISDIPVIPQIKPTKTLTPEENFNNVQSSEIIEEDKPPNEPQRELVQASKGDEMISPPEVHTIIQETEQFYPNSGTSGSDDDSVTENSESLDDQLDTLVNEINDEGTATVTITTATPPAQPQQQKESVFLRLSNRLKALELNMSLSGQYLEELSRRYKRQVEEMQRLLDKTIITLNEDNRKKEERAERLEQQIYLLKETVDTLIEERNSWQNVVYWFIFIITLTGTVLLCKRNTDTKQPTVDSATKNSESLRRKSIGVVTHKSPKKKKRRPSEEAAMINGTYSDLLVNNDIEIVDKPNKKRKRRKQNLFRSNSVATLTEEVPDNDNRTCKTIDGATGMSLAPTTISNLKRQNEPDLRLPTEWVENSTYEHSIIKDIPFVLEESEHSTLEPISYISEDNKSKFVVTTVNTDTDGTYQNSIKNEHKNSESLDGYNTQRTPSPVNTSSLNGSLPDESLIELPRREKKNFLKKIFKNINFK